MPFVSRGLFGRFIDDDTQFLGLNVESGELCHLNKAGADILKALYASSSLLIVTERIASAYGIGREEATASVAAFVNNLRAEGHVQDEVATELCDLSNASRFKKAFELYAAELLIPVFASVELLGRCHLNCIHCYIPPAVRTVSSTTKPSTGLSTEQLFKTLDQLRAMGVLFLKITGGEIFLRRDIFKILEYASATGFILELLTSATPINEKVVSKLLGCSISKIQVSLYGDNAQIHESITKKLGSFKKTIEGIALLQRAGFYVEIANSVMRENFESRIALQSLATAMGVRLISSYPISRQTDGGLAPLEHAMTELQLEEIVKEDFLEFEEIPFGEEALCNAGRGRLAIYADGTVSPCSSFGLPVGNVITDDLKSLWQNNVALNELRLRKRGEVDTTLKGDSKPVLFCPGENYIDNGDYMKMASSYEAVAKSYSRVQLKGRVL